MEALVNAIFFGFIAFFVAIPFWSIYLLVVLRRKRKKRVSRNRQEEERKKYAGSALGVLYALCMVSFTVFAIFWSPDPADILGQYISDSNWQPFFSGSEVSFSGDRHRSDTYITTNIPLELIPELLETSILDDCNNDRLRETACSEPIWFRADRDEYDKRFGHNKPWVLETIISFRSGEYCTYAGFPPSWEADDTPTPYTIAPSHVYQAACVNTETGVFKFDVAP